MIRERRPEDLDRLCAVLQAIEPESPLLSGLDLKGWLEEHDAERSWVFDMAPVSVAPTKNVVGHVQIIRPAKDSPVARSLANTHATPDNSLAIVKLFVKPNGYEYGIGRYLLKESIKYIQGQGKIPVLDVHGNAFLSKEFYAKYGFEEVPSADPAVAPMIFAR
ncbi:GNAT family N-acetyltransferase [Mycobacterium sp. URHB0044]|jgi:ribosomal protein S18 acetylase RimI-like enzyme|uniref:GNAT family N-acetyltransferase n=1 Tax=Mycobacterium sp. URHB0044 TaxID=1380386 RepID=UPI00048A9A7C|nr:GNAT family N-acetyltransferase [Mycobacterium sp. URHB0044]